MKRKLLGVLMCLVLAASCLAACGGDTAETQGETKVRDKPSKGGITS